MTSLLALVVVHACALKVAEWRRYRHSISALCGTWRGEQDNQFTFKDDGTGHGYVVDPAQSTFCRWGQNGTHLNGYFEPKHKTIAQRFEQVFRGLPQCMHSRYSIQNVNETNLVLIDPVMADQTLQFNRIASRITDTHPSPD